MITYLPKIYPDELVYSWFCRYYVHSGYYSHSTALLELLKNRSNNPSKEFVGNLKPEIRKQINQIYPMDKLILDHTMFPQYARFIPAEKKINALHKMINESCDPKCLFPILPRKDGEKYLKFCPSCTMEDREKYGEAYWHRNHQIRGMNICVKHRCRLQESDITAKSEQTFKFYPAEEYIQDIKTEKVPDNDVFKFATFLEEVFYAPIDLGNNTPISSVLYHIMKNTKYFHQSSKNRNTKMFANDVQEYYKNIGFVNVVSFYQIQRALLEDKDEFLTICQIAFFLGINANDLTKSCLTEEQIEQERNSHYAKKHTPIDWVLLDKESYPLIKAYADDLYNGRLNSDGKPEKVTENKLLKEFNFPQHRLENMPKCSEIIEQYKETYPEFWARKIIWAYNKLKNDREHFYWSDVRELSCVKKIHFEETIPYLYSYCDKNIVENIMILVNTNQ